MHAFEHMAAWILLAVLLCICPVFLWQRGHDAIVRSSVMELTYDCVERWKREGIIRREDYEGVLEELEILGSFRMTPDYRKRVLEPVWQEGEIVEVSTAYLYVPWEEVEKELYDGLGYYVLGRDDLLVVEVKPETPGEGALIWKRIFGVIPDYRIRYGGIVTGVAD